MTKKGESAKATQDVEETKKLETLQDYKDDGWKVGPNVKMSYPPVYTLTKGDETIQFRPKMKDMPGGGVQPPIRPKSLDRPKRINPKIRSLNAEGGMIKGYKKGGSVKKNKSNMITTRGWGASRKT